MHVLTFTLTENTADLAQDVTLWVEKLHDFLSAYWKMAIKKGIIITGKWQ